MGRRVVADFADIRDVGRLSTVVDRGVAQLGRLDIVCANAGITGTSDTGPRDLEERLRVFRQVVDINLTGTFCTIEAVKPSLITTGGGSVIITNSLAGLRAQTTGGYAESKHGLIGLARAYARELAPHGIRVNSVHPTTVNTPMIMNDATYRLFRPDLESPTRSDAEEAFRAMHLLSVPYVEPSDVSNAVLWLASDESRYVTGVSLPVDAGGAIK